MSFGSFLGNRINCLQPSLRSINTRMNLNELHSFKLSDAIKFHKELNPKLWKNDQLDPLVKKQLLVIAEDFVEELGIDDLDVVDITISGSNAAYTYTDHSDLDLHILVNMSELHQDAIYRELFRAKKTLPFTVFLLNCMCKIQQSLLSR